MRTETPDEITVEIPTDNGGTISIRISEDDFIIDAARGRPEPLLDHASKVVGASIKAAASHPIDINVAWWYAAARAGAFDTFSRRPRENAERLAYIFRDNWQTMQHASDRRISIQILMLYYETDIRAKILWQAGSRQAGGIIASHTIYSFGGRLTPNLAAKASLGIHNFFASAAGAVTRACIAIMESANPNDATGHIIGPHFLINAFLTGNDDTINMATAMGPHTYYLLLQHLRENPDAIRIKDAELRAIEKIFVWLEDFFLSPQTALNNIPSDMELESLR